MILFYINVTVTFYYYEVSVQTSNRNESLSFHQYPKIDKIKQKLQRSPYESRERILQKTS